MKAGKNINYFKLMLTAMILLPAFLVYSSNAARLKDIATIEGFSDVQVIGYGLVTGLNNTGDNQLSTFTVQSVSNMLKRFGLTIPQFNPRIRNVAAVMITANIPNFMHRGSKIDVQVSSIGDASSLQGGILLMTPLSTADGSIVGMAQGAVTVGGYDVQSLGSRVTKNMVTSGRVANGLILEKNLEGKYINNSQLNILLRDPDFTTSSRVAAAINGLSGLANSAVPLDAATIQVKMPTGQNQTQIMQLISQIESISITSDPVARVVINERTGTIVIGGNVQLLPAVIANSGLEISVQKYVLLRNQAPFTLKAPPPAETSVITIDEEMNPAAALNVRGATVKDIADALNLLKVSPRDLISIFQALKEAGALQGELIIQ